MSGSASLDVVNGQEVTTMQHTNKFPTFRRPGGGRPEDAALADFPLEERIEVALAHQPWASASNLARRLDSSDPDIHKVCRKLETSGSIAGRELGVTRRIQRRYVLTLQGVMHVTKEFEYKGLLRKALPLTFQMVEDGVTRMLLWLPMIESLYEILPNFWTGGLAAPFQWQSMYADPSCSSYVWMGEPTLTEVLWLPRGRLHAVATWRFERYGEPPRYYSVPFFWTGLLLQEDYRSRSLRLGSEYVRSLRSPEDKILWDIEPPVVAIAVDQFSAFRARTAYGDDVQVGAADTAGTLVWSAEASHSEWTLGDNPPQPKSIGRPEAAAIGEGHDLANLGGYAGVPGSRLFIRIQGCHESEPCEGLAHVPRRNQHRVSAPGRPGTGYRCWGKPLRHPAGPQVVGCSR